MLPLLFVIHSLSKTDLSYPLLFVTSALQVTVVGYNHKLTILLETVIQRIAKFEVKPERFAVIKVRIYSVLI